MVTDGRARVKAKLKRYRLLGAKKKNLELQRAHMEKELNLYSAPIGHYGESSSGGRAGVSSVEKAAARRENIRERLALLNNDIEAVELERQQIDNALEVLPEEGQEVIKALFFSGMTIAGASMALAYSERTLRRREAEALEALAVVL